MAEQAIFSTPTYFLKSVDNALHLAQVLRDEGTLRLSDAAELLEVAPSTAHRLLAMLMHRGFAVQDDSRVYLPGPSLSVHAAPTDFGRRLREVSEPYLVRLRDTLDESVNLMMRVGTAVRFLFTAESSQALRVGDRQGAILPARLVSGGKAILAQLEPAYLAKIYRRSDLGSGSGLSTADFRRMFAELQIAKQRGYAVNISETEPGVCAIGVALRMGAGGHARGGAFSVSAPESRFSRLTSDAVVQLIQSTAHEIEDEFALAATT
jgi:DNA-binding IclR family transcriptional regulator